MKALRARLLAGKQRARARRAEHPPGLNQRQARFVAEYLIDLNASAAYVRAGYRARGTNAVKASASRLLTHADVAAAIAAAQAAALGRSQLTATRVLEEMRRLALSDMREYYDAAGNLKTMAQLTAEQGAALSSVESVRKNIDSADGETDTVWRVRLWDKVRALEMLGKHFALLTERVSVEADEKLLALLASGREHHVRNTGNDG